MMVNKYFNFTFPGEKLLLIIVLFYVGIMLPYAIAVISYITIGSIELQSMELTQSLTFWAIIYLWVFFIVIATILLRIIILKKFVQNFKFHQDHFDFTGSIWKFLWINVRDSILSFASFGLYYSWYMENIAHFIFSNIKFNNHSIKFQGKGGNLLKIFLLYYLVPVGIYYYYYYSMFWGSAMNMDLENIWSMYSQMFGLITVLYILLIPFWYKAIKWIIDLEYNGHNINLHDDSWNSLGFLAKEIIFTLLSLGIYFPAALIRIYIYFISHLGISDKEGINFLRFNRIQTNQCFKFIWGQLLLSFISSGIYFPFAICKIAKWFSQNTYLLVYEEDIEENEGTLELVESKI